MEFKIQTIEKLFLYIVALSYLLLPVSFVFSKSKIKNLFPLLLGLYGIVFCCLIMSYEYIPKELRPHFKTIYTFLEYSFFAFVFWKNIEGKKIKHFILIASVLFFALQVFYLLTTSVHLLDTIPIGVETILIFIYIFFFFYEFSRNSNGSYIFGHSCFWISVGTLIYLGGSFFFFILIEHLSKEQITEFGNLTFVAEIIKNILFAVALFVYARYPYKNPKKNSNSLPYLDMI